jgi:anti-sigma factor RsiW
MHLDDDTLQRYFDGELPMQQAQAVQKHVEQSPEAQRRLRELARLGDLIRLAAAEAAHSVDSDALFSRVEAQIQEQKQLGFGERLRLLSSEWSEHRRGVLVPMLGAAAAAAAALAIVLVPRQAAEPSAGARPAAEQAGVALAHGSRIENVDFGSNTGTVFEVDNQGVAAAVVWIADDEEEPL